MARRHLQLHVSVFEGMIVSTHTLRSEDLLRTFWNLADRWGIRTGFQSDAYRLIGSGWSEQGEADSHDLVNDYFTFFDSIAPAGYYFGSNIGDGACFGFFQLDDLGDEPKI